MVCKKFKLSIEYFSSLGELALYGVPAGVLVRRLGSESILHTNDVVLDHARDPKSAAPRLNVIRHEQ